MSPYTLDGGPGGNLGLPGTPGNPTAGANPAPGGAGGAAGYAWNGQSMLNYSGSGNVFGPGIN